MRSFQHAQLEFTRHLRAPADNPAPTHLEDRRVGIYRDLVYNNIAGFIAGAFPIVKAVLTDEHWHAMVRDFVARHRSQTPYFLEISQEFLAYLSNERSHSDECDSEYEDPPFLVELAHYEWVELALDVAEEEISPASVTSTSVLDAHPRVSPLAWCLAYQFPVHHIGATYQPTTANSTPTFLIAYRNRADSVNFMEVNAMTYGLLHLLQENDALTGREALLQIAAQIGHQDQQQFLAQGEELLQQLLAADIISGLE